MSSLDPTVKPRPVPVAVLTIGTAEHHEFQLTPCSRTERQRSRRFLRPSGCLPARGPSTAALRTRP